MFAYLKLGKPGAFGRLDCLREQRDVCGIFVHEDDLLQVVERLHCFKLPHSATNPRKKKFSSHLCSSLVDSHACAATPRDTPEGLPAKSRVRSRGTGKKASQARKRSQREREKTRKRRKVFLSRRRQPCLREEK